MEDLERVRAELKELVIKYTPPVHLTVLLRGYSIKMKEEVPFKRYGFKDPAAFFSAKIPELELTETENGLLQVNLRDADSIHSEDSTSSGVSCLASNNSSTCSSSSVNGVSSTGASVPLSGFRRLSVSKGISSPWKKAIPTQFKLFLSRLIEKYPQGISARDFVDAFYNISGSHLSYDMYGYPGHLSMFKDLPDVFVIQSVANNVTLYPVPKKKSIAEVREQTLNRFKYDKNQESQRDCDLVNTALSKSDNQVKSLSSPVSHPSPTLKKVEQSGTNVGEVAKWTTSHGDIVTVLFHESIMVPSSCLASLLSLKRDSILEELNNRNISIRNVKFLTKEKPDHDRLRMKIATTGCPMIIQDDGELLEVISLIPLSACSFIVSAFLPTTTSVLKLNNELDKVAKGIVSFLSKPTQTS